MSLFDTCAKLAVYLLIVGVALELSHRLYWKISSHITSAVSSTPARCLLGIAAACVPLTVTIAITVVFVTFVDKHSLDCLGLTYDGSSFTNVSYGAAVALGCVTFVFLLGVLMGYIEVRRSALSEDCIACVPQFLGGLVDFFTAAVFEEVIFRGYVFFILYQAIGPMPAVLASSMVFAVAHLVKHPATPVIFALNALVFGTIVALCRYYTGSLWLPIGLHFGWNVVSGPIFGLPYSGRTYDKGVVVSEVSGPAWLTGGLYSLDAGLLGTIALAIAAAGLVSIAPIH